jgi:hypothetical protein
MQDTRGVWTELDARSDLAQLRRLLVHVHVETDAQQ